MVGALVRKATGLVADYAHQPALGTLWVDGKLHDYSRYKNHGTPTNVTVTTLPSGLAVATFVGDGYISLGTSLSLNPTENWAWIGWVYWTGTGNSGIWTNDVTAGVGHIQFGINVADSKGYLYRNPDVGGAGEVTGIGTAFAVTTWYLIAFVKVGIALYWYRNGVLDYTHLTQLGSTYTSAAEKRLGDILALGGLEGRIALSREYNRALSATKLGTGNGSIFKAERGWFGV